MKHDTMYIELVIAMSGSQSYDKKHTNGKIKQNESTGSGSKTSARTPSCNGPSSIKFYVIIVLLFSQFTSSRFGLNLVLLVSIGNIVISI